MKKILTILLISIFTITSTSCDKYLDVNTDTDSPDYVDTYLYLSGIQAAYVSLYWDIRCGCALPQMLGSSYYTNFANNYYSSASDAGGEIWKMTYWLQGFNLENMINQGIEDESWAYVGVGYALKAYSWDIMTKYHGEVILEDAFVSGLLSHNYDYQDAVYEQVRAWAELAIEYLEKEDNFSYGTNFSSSDIMYGGDKSKWIKFAHGVIVNNLASLTNKSNFLTDYADDLIAHAALALQTADDDATVAVSGGGTSEPYSDYNNFWGTTRGNLSNYYWQHDFAVQVFTGTVPQYDETTGNKVLAANYNDEEDMYYPYALMDTQIITDTLVNEYGHYDPRVAVKLSTADDPYYKNIDNIDSIKARKYYGSMFTSASGPIGTAPNLYGRTASSSSATYDGQGRWLYHDAAPYILMTAAQIKFCLAEAYYLKGNKADALAALQAGVAADMDFTANHIKAGSYLEGVTGGGKPGGDKITADVFNTAAAEYLNGPYVGGLSQSDLTLSHIMMQKWVALFPWGALEAWVDLRKNHFDISYTGDYPSSSNGWTNTSVDQKWDTDDTKVYKGFYLAPAQVENRKLTYYTYNQGSPAYRVRPRYNSEYMWNVPSLEALLPISGTADNYHCSIPWFAYPGDYPTN